MKVSVLGAGPWGSTIANLIKRTSDEVEVTLWAFQNILDKNIGLDEGVKHSDDINSVIEHGEIIFVVINSNFLDMTLSGVKGDISNKKFVLLTKGFVKKDKHHLPYDYFIDHFNIPKENLAVVSGPNIAKEINDNKKTFTTIASTNKEFALEIKKLLQNDYFIPFISDDVVGVEASGILKNPYAISVGIVEKQNPGSNYISAFMALCIKEISKLTELIGGRKETAFGISGSGDFFTTCFTGRNKKVGEMIGEGKSIQDVYDYFSPQKPEGVEQIKVLYEMFSSEDLPIFKTLYDILFNGKDIKSMLEIEF